MKTIFIGPVVRLLFRPWIKGLDNIPDGPAILASNHMSFSDSIFLPLAVPRPVVFLAKSEYFNGRGLKGRMTAAFSGLPTSCRWTAQAEPRRRRRCPGEQMS